MDEQPKREDQIADRIEQGFDPTQRALNDREKAAGEDSQMASADAGATENAENAAEGLQQKEETVNNEFGYEKTGKDGKATLTTRRDLLKRLGPAGVITLLFGGGFGILTTLLSPGIALIHVKEIVEQKVNTMASVLEKRSDQLMSTRLLGGTNNATKGKCASGVKVFCRYTGFSDEQVKTMKENGLNPVGGSVDEKSGKLTGVKYLEMSDGTQIKPNQYRKAVQTNYQFRDVMRKVYPSRFAAWNDKIATTVSTIQRWARNPKSITADEGGDPKTNQKEFNKNLQEEELGGRGTGTKLPSGYDEGDYASAIDEETARIEQGIQDGTSTRLSADPGAALTANPTSVDKSLIKKAAGTALDSVNLASVAVGGCMSYRYERTIIYAAKVLAFSQVIRYASHIMSVGDKIKAGNATPNDVAMIMTMFYAINEYGNTFGDSAGYHYAAYGKTTNQAVSAPVASSPLLSFLINNQRFINKFGTVKFSGLKYNTLPGACSAIVSPIGQLVGGIAGVVVGILTGGSSAVGEEAVGAGARLSVKTLVKKFTEKLTEKFGSREAFKATAYAAGKDLLKMAGSVAGFFVAGHLISTYLTPYLAHVAAGSLFGGDMDGVAAMDALVAGAGGMAGGVALSRGMMPLTRKQALAFNQFQNSSTGVYVADQKRNADPLDIYNPYSSANSLGFTLSSSLQPQKYIDNPLSLLSAPAGVFGSILSGSTNATASAATSSSDIQATMDECGDEDIKSTGLATDPFCNPIYGFPDVSMVENTSPDDVAKWMLDRGYIDNEGNPINEYADYVATCFEGESSMQVISPLLSGDESSLPPECYNQDGSKVARVANSEVASTTAAAHEATDKMKYFHLYQIDKSVLNTVDEGFPESASSTTGGSAGSSFRLATFNIFYSGGGSKSGTVCTDICRDWSARLDQSVKVIKDTNLDVVGLQEVTKDQWKAIQKRLGGSYTIYPIPYGGLYPGGNSIIWRSDKFTLVEGKAIPARSVHNQPATTPQVRLRDNSTGQEFYVVNTHEPVDSGLDRYNSDLKWLDYIKKLSGDGLPIFFTGDFNASYMNDSGNPNKFLNNDPNKAIYCMLSKQGILWDSYDASKELTGDCPTSKSPGPAGDHIFISRNVSVTKYGRVSSRVNGSDVHDTVWSDVVIPGSGSNGSVQYTNPVYKGLAADPSTIQGSDGTYYTYITGGTQLSSKDMVHWKKTDGNWNLKNGGKYSCMWAPDVAKVGSYYVLTYAGISNCSSPGAVGNVSGIRYAIGTSAGGPFTYKGTLTTQGYAIDPHIFVDDNGKVWLNFGGGVIYVAELKLNGNSLSISGPIKEIFRKTSDPTVENGWIQKKNGWYYLYYSQGHYNKADGAPEYSTNVARSKNVDGPYTPTNYKQILTGDGGKFWGPGGGSIITDQGGNDWLVYHAWYKGTRALLIDPITYTNGWPVMGNGHPSTTSQLGPSLSSGGGLTL